ncbi:phage tail tape measure protein [Gryllotalpicola reticulitermitis]|uniref:Phage tail tape measure protein n=1 Tax=Gryllotalpicola reticulitermitis TaxID=1184153 RepID=A0ABV8QAH2_9MICO
MAIPPLLFEIRASAKEVITASKEAQASIGEMASTTDAAATRVQAAIAKQVSADARLAEANAVTADSIKASVQAQVDAQAKLAAETGVSFDAEARSAQLTAAAVQKAAGEQVAAQEAASKAATEAASVTSAAAAESGGAMSKGFDKVASFGKMAAVGVVAGGVAVAAVTTKMATDFQKNMSLLSTAADEPSAKVKQISNGVLQLAQSTGTAVDQLAEGAYTVSKSQGTTSAANQLNVLKAAAQGAKAEGVDLGTATNALTSVMQSYGKSLGGPVQAENAIIAASGKSKTTMQEFAGSLATVVPLASASHISFSDVGASIATLTQHGTSAREATQELSNTIRSLQAPNQVAQKAMQQMGVSVTDVEQKLGQRGIGGTIDYLTQTIASKMGPSGTVLVDTMKKSQSATQDLQVMLGKMPKSLANISEQFESGKMSYTDYNKAIKGLGGSSYSMGTQFLSLSKTAQGFNDYLKSGQPAAQTYTAALKAVMGGATGLNTALQLSSDASKKTYSSDATAIAAAAKKGGDSVSSWAKTQKNLSVQMDEAGQSFETTGIKIGTVLLPYVMAAVKGFNQFAQNLSAHKGELIAVASVIGGVLAAAIVAWTVKVTVMAVQSAIRYAQMIAGAVKWSVQTIAAIARTLAGWVTYAAQWVASQVAALANWAAANASAMAGWIAKQATSIAQSTAMWVRYLASQISSTVSSMARWVAAQAAALASSTAKWVAYFAVQAAQMVKQGAMWVASTAKTVAQLAIQNGALLLSKAVMLASTAATVIATAATTAFGIAVDIATGPIGIIILAIAALVAGIILLVTHWKQVSAFLQTVWAAVMKWLEGQLTQFVSDWIEIWDTIRTFFTTVWNSLKGIITNAWSAVTSWARGIPSTVMGWFAGAGSWLLDAGRNIVQGLINGVEGMAQQAVATVENLGKSITSSIKNILGIHSPSLVFQSIGSYVVQGFANGITGNASQATSAIDSLSQKITTTAVTKIAALQQQIQTAQRSIMSTEAGKITAKGVLSINNNNDTIASDNALIAQISSEERVAQAAISSDKRTLESYATQKTALAAKIKTAQTAYNNAVNTRNQFQSSTDQSLVSLGDIGQDATGTAMVADLKNKVNGFKKFQTDMQTLSKWGLDKTSYQQLLNAFMQSGSTAQADSLVQEGAGTVKQLATLQKQFTSSASALSTSAANTMYQAGVNTAAGLLDGLKSKNNEVTEAAKNLANQLTTQVKKALGIHSPSTVFRDEIGAQIIAGWAQGITGNQHKVASAIGGVPTMPTVSAGTGGPGVAGKTVNITVLAQTNASPNKIANQIGWVAQAQGGI